MTVVGNSVSVKIRFPLLKSFSAGRIFSERGSNYIHLRIRVKEQTGGER